MEQNQTPTAPVATPQVVVEQPLPAQAGKQSNFLVILLSVLLLLSVSIAGFFAFQTQKLVKELTALKTEEKVVAVATEASTTESIATEVDPTADWKIYTDKNDKFSFKYPKNWYLWNSADGDSLLLDESSFDPNLIVEPDQVDITITTTSNKELMNAYTANFLPTSQVTTNNNVVFKIEDKSLNPKEEGPASQYLFAQTVINNNLYRFGLTQSTFKSTFDQILSTFKFNN